jgi:hypothetical protein
MLENITTASAILELLLVVVFFYILGLLPKEEYFILSSLDGETASNLPI